MVNVLRAFIFQPGKSLRMLRLLPLALDGSRFADGWSSSPNFASDKEPAFKRNAGRLQSYFDSHRDGRGIVKWMHYFDIYERHLEKFVGRKVHIAEVGVFSGGSMQMWHSYFGADCVVYGIDIREECKAYEDERTKIFIGDQGDRTFWKNFRSNVPPIDIFIDDGSHLTEDQIITLEEILPHMRPGGVYICEDVHGSQNRFSGYMQGLSSQLNAMVKDGPELSPVIATEFQRAIQSVHLYPFLTIIEKSIERRDRFEAVRRGTEWQPFV